MGKAQTKATNKYIEKAYDRINLTVPKGEKDRIREHAESMGESVNAFINRAINETIQREQEEIEPVSYQEYLQTVKGIIERNRAEREKRKKEKGE